jgi:glutamate synthase (NADPH/NADH) small chain
MQQSRIKMNERACEERIHDFREVSLGFSREQAMQEAARCLQCKEHPCTEGCPVGVAIPEFIGALALDRLDEADMILKERNKLPAVCGRVCPREMQCEKLCVLAEKGQPVAIGHLERYVADWGKISGYDPPAVVKNSASEPSVAVIGSDPAGLTCAGELARMGFNVTIFESLHEPGGVLRYGIPEFRLPKEILDHELGNLRALGVKIVTNALVGRKKSSDDLFCEGFEAVFFGAGAGSPKFMGIPGENLKNVYSAGEFLARLNHMNGNSFAGRDMPVPAGKRVAVIGGGSTAVDSARCALRLGAKEITLVYRRSREEMPARAEEVHHAEEEGVKFSFLTDPVAYKGDERGFITKMECLKTELGEPDESGRRRPRAVNGSNFTAPVDMVIVSIGLSPDPLIPALAKGRETDSRGEWNTEEDFMTIKHGVFALGDMAGGKTVIRDMGMGKRAAQSIKNYLYEKRVEY